MLGASHRHDKSHGRRWQELRKSQLLAFSAAQDAIDMAREHARVRHLEPLTAAAPRQAAVATKAKAGLGIDRAAPLDFENVAQLRAA